MRRRINHHEAQTPLAAMLIGIFVVCFGIFWTIMAGSMFPPMAIFGILFTAIGAVNAYNTYKVIKSKDEKANETPDYFESKESPKELRCPYCGAPIHESDRECEYCGSRL